MNIQILYEDDYLVVCIKPSGIATQSKKVGTPDMVSLLKNHIYQNSTKKEEPYIAVIHRLDQPVSGILVFAKSPWAAKELNRQLQHGEFGKYYKALLSKRPLRETDTLEDYLIKDGKTNMSCICESNMIGAKKAVLKYRIIEKNIGEMTVADGATLVEVELQTGRHHQIRVQMAGMGCPIEGDVKYGIASTGIERKSIALCAYRLEFIHPKTHKKLQYECNPLDFWE
ncbi:MAG: RluA family pseudouridine synthase [Lachnospiraceae bacterium]